MRSLTIVFGVLLGLSWPGVAAAQDYDEDDPVAYDWRKRDYRESGRHFGTNFYPRYGRRNSPMARRNDNRDVRRYPPGDVRDRYSRNYGLPVTSRFRPRYDDPNPFDNAYGEPRGSHYIAADASNFRGGRYATDYPGFHGGWYGRDHRIRIRAGEYTADDFTNAYWDHPHRARSYPGKHGWTAHFGSR